MVVERYITVGGSIIEKGDFYGGGEEEVVETMEHEDKILTINTTIGPYEVTLVAGDYLFYEDGTAKLIKSKYDLQDE